MAFLASCAWVISRFSLNSRTRFRLRAVFASAWYCTFVSITPERVPDGQFPETSTTNVGRGLIKANLAIVPVGPDGRIHLYNAAGELDLLVDVFAWLESGKSDTTYEGRIIPLESPFRVWDTRQPEFGNVPLGFASQEN